jgi:cytochrome c oxidase assembly protein subunit 15
MEALLAIHMAHRLMALVLFVAMGVLAWALWRASDPALRRVAQVLIALAAWQFFSGLSNVVLGWPLAAALAHSAGAAAMVWVTTSLLARARAGRRLVERVGGLSVSDGAIRSAPVALTSGQSAS